jgi:3-phenylpropionate/trans-cinnamate dioxygenase ferredoxin component
MEDKTKAAALSREEKINLAHDDSGSYFRSMADFVGFTQEDAEAIRDTGLIVEKYLPEIVSRFYTHLLSYPPTRQHFINHEGKVDQDYLQLRMHHLTNFWRRTANGKYDDEYARYVDYVGRAHTSHGADASIYIQERYVIGQVGFMQYAITSAISKELHSIDPDLELRGLKAWNLLMMVILEMLSRAYTDERIQEIHHAPAHVNHQAVFDLAVDTYESGLGLQRSLEMSDIAVCAEIEIPNGERKIVQVGDLSIGIFHHQGSWYALRNSCLHRGGPVCSGALNGDVLICPWHGYEYNLTNGQLLVDPTAHLAVYPIHVQDGQIHLQIPQSSRQDYDLTLKDERTSPVETSLKENEFRLNELEPGRMKLVSLAGKPVTVYNVDGKYYATQDSCSHVGGPLHEGELNGAVVTCPWHGSCFDVTDGRVIQGPARQPIQTFQVIKDGELGRVV